MSVGGDAEARIGELERALQARADEVARLMKLVDARSRELIAVKERSKRQAQLVGARTAIALLAQHGTLERAAPQMLEAFRGLDLQSGEL